jgi:hypothetical protein
VFNKWEAVTRLSEQWWSNSGINTCLKFEAKLEKISSITAEKDLVKEKAENLATNDSNGTGGD